MHLQPSKSSSRSVDSLLDQSTSTRVKLDLNSSAAHFSSNHFSDSLAFHNKHPIAHHNKALDYQQTAHFRSSDQQTNAQHCTLSLHPVEHQFSHNAFHRKVRTSISTPRACELALRNLGCFRVGSSAYSCFPAQRHLQDHPCHHPPASRSLP
jgi:hypothetical protein